MRTAKEMEEIRQGDSKKIELINRKAESIAQSRIAEIQERANALKEKIQQLMDKKHAVFCEPSSKAETLALALESFKKQREKFFFEGLLLEHLKGCQSVHNVFLNEATMRLFLERNGWRLVYAIITEDEIKRAAELLPDIGLSTEEKEKRVKKIDDEIAALEKQVETELRKL